MYLDIGCVSLTVAPCQRHRSVQPVGIVEFASLQVQKQRGVRLLYVWIKRNIAN